MPVDKLGWFRKTLGSLGKRIYHWKADKMNLFGLNVMIRSLVRIYAELNGGNYEKGLEVFSSQVGDEARNLITEMILDPIAFGMSLNAVMSKDPEDLLYISSILFWSILGKNYKDLWEDFEIIKEDNGVIKMVMRQKVCLLCAEERELTQENFGSLSMGEIFASLLGGIIRALEEYVGNDYEITARETKCLMRGDRYGEVTLWLQPRE